MVVLVYLLLVVVLLLIIGFFVAIGYLFFKHPLICLYILCITLLFSSSTQKVKKSNVNSLNSIAEICTQKTEETQNRLDTIIKAYSMITSYDYSKYLDNMSHRELIEKYIPELLESKDGKTDSSISTLLKQLDCYQEILDVLEKHDNTLLKE